MRILIVDDNAANLSLLRQMLARIGYKTIEVTNGPAAIEIVKQQNIDIIMMDIMMPGMDGFETTKIIKQYAGNNHIPVIFVTALKGEEALGNALESGGDDYISKPINFETLKSKVHAHARIRELTQQILAKNVELSSHNRRLQHEHELISYFFDNALARSYIDKRCIRYHFSPMSGFNGDLMLSRRSPSGGLYLLLGDFTGHGLTAAMGTLPVAQLFFSLTKKGLSVGDLAKKINATLKKLLPEDLFFASSIVEISASGSRLDLWNGGMPASIIASRNGEKLQALESQHMPLGILDENEFDPVSIQYALDKGDRLILYTDGIIETKNVHGEEFGEQRLQALFRESGDLLFEAIQKNITTFRNDPGQQDDLSLVEVLCDQLPEDDATQQETHTTKNRLPWSFSTTISNNSLQTTNPVSCIMDTLDAALSLGHHKGLIYTVLSEAYNNALNHSILGLNGSRRSDDEGLLQYYSQRERALAELQNAYIKCDMKFTPDDYPGTLHIRLEDSGNNASAHPSNINSNAQNTSDSAELHGRGLLLLSELCSEVRLNHQENLIELDYKLS